MVITLETELWATNETSWYAVREVKLSQSAVYTSRRERFEEEEFQNKRPLGAIICRENAKYRHGRMYCISQGRGRPRLAHSTHRLTQFNGKSKIVTVVEFFSTLF